jgi:hypothetical protein
MWLAQLPLSSCRDLSPIALPLPPAGVAWRCEAGPFGTTCKAGVLDHETVAGVILGVPRLCGFEVAIHLVAIGDLQHRLQQSPRPWGWTVGSTPIVSRYQCGSGG